MTPSSATESISVDVSGIDAMKLITTPVDHTDDVEYDYRNGPTLESAKDRV